MSRRPAGVGNAERAWRDWPGFDSLPVIAPEILVPHGCRAVVVAPRADDETLGLGGLIYRLLAVGRPILFVAATDRPAGASLPSRWTPQHKASEWLPTALRTVPSPGGVRSTILRSGVQDGELARIEDDLEWRLRGLILPSDVVLASWRYDGHPDYEAMGRVASRACAALFTPLVEVPVWTWHWSFPGDRRIPWHRARRVFLDRTLRARKRLALAESRGRPRTDTGSGGAALLARYVARFVRPYEIVFV
jgi:LmbE family N-acetylglucosaminyl deacetylase